MGIYDAYSTGFDNARRRQREDQQLREHDEQRDYQRDYASAYGAGEFNRAGKIAGQYGDVEGVTGAREGQQQALQQERLEAYREARPFYDELTAIGQEPEETRAPRYQQWAQRLHQAVADDPQLSSWAQQNVPLDAYNPQIQGNLQNRLQRMLEILLSADEISQLQVRNEDRDFRREIFEETRRHNQAQEQTDLMRAQRSGGDGVSGSQEFSRANSLRDEYNAQTSSYRTVADIARRSEEYYRRVATNPQGASGQGDVGLVYALAKIYDPTSVVREGEFATMARQGGYGEQMRSWVLQAQGRGFSPAIRDQIMTEIRNGLASQGTQRDQTRTRYIGLAERSGIDPSLVIDDYSGGAPQIVPNGDGSSGGALPPIAQRRIGQAYPMPDGRQATWNGRVFIPVEE